jgi:hypothetical protein
MRDVREEREFLPRGPSDQLVIGWSNHGKLRGEELVPPH